MLLPIPLPITDGLPPICSYRRTDSVNYFSGISWLPQHHDVAIKMQGSGEGLTRYVIVLSPDAAGAYSEDIDLPRPKMIGVLMGKLTSIKKVRFSKELI